jgi:hypothetical protein
MSNDARVAIITGATSGIGRTPRPMRRPVCAGW